MTSRDVEDPSDAEYLARARAGDDDAFAALFARHHESAHRAAARLTTPDRADDLVSEAFARIYALLRDGRGPTATFRGYLMAAVRSLHVDHVRQDTRHSWMGDLSVLGDLVSVDDGSEGRFRDAAIGRAFRGLPERWQIVLWFTAIEGLSITEVAGLLGIGAHAAAQLSYRAREGLRQKYLAEHVGVIDSDSCARVVDLLPGYVRDGLNGGRRSTVTNHLAGCLRCSTAVAEIAAVNKDLRMLLLPLVLGTAPAAAPVPPPAPRPRFSTRTLLAGAAAGVAVALAAAPLLSPPGQSTPSALTEHVVVRDLAPDAVRDSPPVRLRVHARHRSAQPRPQPAASPGLPRAAPTPSDPAVPGPSLLVAPLTAETSPAPLVEDLVLGPASAEPVDPSRPRVLHTAFRVDRALPGSVAILTVAPAVERFSVHLEHEYGDWRCVPRSSTAARSTLRCVLGPVRGSADLGLDLWVGGPSTATLSLSLPGVRDPSPADNQVRLALAR